MAVLGRDDRRKNSRVGFTAEIKIVLTLWEKQIKLAGNSRDLSRKGIFVSTDQRFPPGTPCCVEICLTGGIEKLQLIIEGRIVRETDAGIGIVFNSMDLETFSHLKNIVYYNREDDSA